LYVWIPFTEYYRMRVPALVAIPIVAVCAATGLVLGWLFPLTASHHSDVQSPHAAIASRTEIGQVRDSMDRLAPVDRREDEHVTVPPPLPTPAQEDLANSDGPALSTKHVHENVETSNELAHTTSNEGRKPEPSASQEVALPSVARPGAPDAKPQNKSNAQQTKSTKEHTRRSTKEAQKPPTRRFRQERDEHNAREKDRPEREKQPTRSIVSQLPIVGPVFGLLIP
jgi:hypothetical protein